MTAPEQRRFEIEHISEFGYREAARGRLLALRLRPRKSRNQRLLDFALHIDPVAAPIAFEDSFGNVCHLVDIHREHLCIVVRSSSCVEVAAPLDPLGQAGTASWDALAEAADPVRYWEYLHSSRLAFPCPALDAFTAAHGIRRGADPLSSLRDAAPTRGAFFGGGESSLAGRGRKGFPGRRVYEGCQHRVGAELVPRADLLA